MQVTEGQETEKSQKWWVHVVYNAKSGQYHPCGRWLSKDTLWTETSTPNLFMSLVWLALCVPGNGFVSCEEPSEMELIRSTHYKREESRSLSRYGDKWYCCLMLQEFSLPSSCLGAHGLPSPHSIHSCYRHDNCHYPHSTITLCGPRLLR